MHFQRIRLSAFISGCIRRRYLDEMVADAECERFIRIGMADTGAVELQIDARYSADPICNIKIQAAAVRPIHIHGYGWRNHRR
ncbi:hypothetical protein D3C84_1013850 [compost metagenome]